VEAAAVEAARVEAGAVEAGAVEAGAVEAGAVEAGAVEAALVKAAAVESEPVAAAAARAAAKMALTEGAAPATKEVACLRTRTPAVPTAPCAPPFAGASTRGVASPLRPFAGTAAARWPFLGTGGDVSSAMSRLTAATAAATAAWPRAAGASVATPRGALGVGPPEVLADGALSAVRLLAVARGAAREAAREAVRVAAALSPTSP
jgi:hypothetical protein